jgi:hypothetical protein
VKKKHFIFIIQQKTHNFLKNNKIKVLKKKLKHEPNIVEITHLCIRHGVQTSLNTKENHIFVAVVIYAGG